MAGSERPGGGPRLHGPGVAGCGLVAARAFGRIVGAAADPRSATGDAVEHRYALESALVGDLIGDVPDPVAAAEID